MSEKTEAERRAWLQDMKPQMVEILDNACAPGTVIDRDELKHDVTAELKEMRTKPKGYVAFAKHSPDRRTSK